MDFALTSQQSVGGRIASNSGLLFGSKAFGAALGFVTLVLAAANLAPVELATVVFLHGYMLFFSEVMTFQPWQAVIRFGSDDVAVSDERGFARLLNFCFRLDALSSVLAFAASVLLFGAVTALLEAFPGIWPGTDQIDPSTLFGYVLAYNTVMLSQQNGVAIGALRLFDRFVSIAATSLVMPVLRLVGVLVAVQQGWGVVGYIAVWYVASLARYLAILGAGLWELWRRDMLAPTVRAKVSFLQPREGLWAFATKAYIDSSLAAGFSHLPLILVMAFIGPAFVAVYKIAEEVARLLSEGVKLLDQVIYPELARIVAAGRGWQMVRLVTRASLIALGVGVAMAALVYVGGPLVIGYLLSDEYSRVVDVAVLLVIGAAIFAAVAPIYPVFYAVGRPERAIYARLAGIIAYAASFVWLTGWLGDIGSAWAWIVGYAIALVVVLWLVVRTLDGFQPKTLGEPAE